MPAAPSNSDKPDSIVFASVGITDPTTQTGIAAGLSMFTWFCQIGAVIVGRRVGRKTILLCVWPVLLLFFACLMATSGVYTESGETNMGASYASIVFVWLYMGTFNTASESWSRASLTQTPCCTRIPPRCRPFRCAPRVCSCGTRLRRSSTRTLPLSMRSRSRPLVSGDVISSDHRLPILCRVHAAHHHPMVPGQVL